MAALVGGPGTCPGYPTLPIGAPCPPTFSPGTGGPSAGGPSAGGPSAQTFPAGGPGTMMCPDGKTIVRAGTRCPTKTCPGNFTVARGAPCPPIPAGYGKMTCPDGTVVHVGTRCPSQKEGKASAGLSTGSIVWLAVGIPLCVLFIILIGLLIIKKQESTSIRTAYSSSEY